MYVSLYSGTYPHYLTQLFDVCTQPTYHTTKRSSVDLPGVIMHLTTSHRKYDGESEKTTTSYT